MPESPSLTRALIRQVTSTTKSLPEPESMNIGPHVSRREQHDRVCALDVAESGGYYPWPSLPVQPPIPSPDSLIRPNVHIPTHGFSIPGQVISRIEGMATDRNRDGSDHLPRDAAQIFANAVHEVRPHTLSSRGARFDDFPPIGSFLHHSGSESPRSPAAAPEELVEHFVPRMQPLDYTSEISPDPTLLRPTANPAVLRGVCRRVDGRLSRPAGRSKGPEDIPDK